MARAARSEINLPELRTSSLFDLPADFFRGSRLLSERVQSHVSPTEADVYPSKFSASDAINGSKDEDEQLNRATVTPRLSCNTCKAEFESLQDQRTHFKSDIHRFNVKLTIAGKNTISEDQLDELSSGVLLEACDVSSISGSDDEAEGELPNSSVKGSNVTKKKLLIRLNSGDIVSVWKCIILDESEDLTLEHDSLVRSDNGGHKSMEEVIVERLTSLVSEPRHKTHLRIVLLASGGHFAGCVFDGNSVVAHKTFHRYVVRAKAGKKQSTKDATGKAAKSAGSTLRRHNELALKKEVQELLASWKAYFIASSCIFIHASSNNRQLFYDGDKPFFSHQNGVVRHVPLSVRRPTFKEAKLVYNHLTLVVYEKDKRCSPSQNEDKVLSATSSDEIPLDPKKELPRDLVGIEEALDACSGPSSADAIAAPCSTEVALEAPNVNEETALHDASKSGNVQRTLELLEQGLDPCIKDARGKTPYTVAADKEVRNTFRRFMALNLDKWDWRAANVPSPLTTEMEEAQAAKQAEKDAKRKAKAKELKKLRKAKEKTQGQAKTQAEAQVLAQNVPLTSEVEGSAAGLSKGTSLSKEEELRKKLAEEREKRAAAAERRIAALNAVPTASSEAKIISSSSSAAKSSQTDDTLCSCCATCLVGKVPFHRYHYKYCSTSCMYVHKQLLEEG
ncbi:hypothetical protein H6P81_016450 [Aristolochia fimbriata]|uniref:VLRF1 domain-containing protein n=1 Tax=Aristolochia fimbriata TaxID=158543 RepID=A0AAV7E8A5_ARIFI|nr:hypothetical protein H6P81_016450 [Aristolochia fimbriata]